MNRVKRLALVTALPVGAALVVAIAPAFAATGGGSGDAPRAAVAGYEMPSQLMDKTTPPPKETTRPPKETTRPPKETTRPPKETTPPPKETTPAATRTPSPTALPVTGGDRDPNVIWLVASGLLGAGGGLLLLARRLRGRTEA